MSYETSTARRNENYRQENTVSTGVPFWDLMFSLGKASQQVMSAYAPRPAIDAQFDRNTAQQASGNVEVIPIGEETLNVGTRLVTGETTRVRRIVVETPVEQDVSLREERVVVERRKPTGASSTATQTIFTETAVEMSDSFEVAEVWKSVRVTEEVVLRREVTERRETVRDTVRHDEVVVEQAKHTPRALSASRHEVETVQPARNDAASPQLNRPEPAQLAADLKKVAERFEPNAEQPKAPATLHGTSDAEASTPKPDHKNAAPQPSAQPAKAAVEQPKAPVPTKRPETTASQNEKSNPGHKA